MLPRPRNAYLPVPLWPCTTLCRTWRGAGTLYNGEGYTCRIGADGRIDTIDYAGFAARDDRQLGDDRYRAAWANLERQSSAPVPQAEAQPAYPGGPLPGEDRQSTRLNSSH